MIIAEVTRRECCQPQDIRSLHTDSQLGMCKHCMRTHKKQTYTDAAGDRDWEWQPVEPDRQPVLHQFGQ